MTENKNPNENNISLSGKLLSGAVWSISIRWTSKLLGIISLAICARVLSPADYGLVSMATVVVGFASILVELGVETSLIRSQTNSNDLFNTAWSLRIIQRGLIALCVLVSAPIAADIYDDQRITMIMIAVGLAELFCAFENIYTVKLRMNLNFRGDFLYMAVPRFASFSAAVSSVLILETYWGLVIGICTTEVIRTLISYLIVKERPRWTLVAWRSIFNFSSWFMLRGLGEFLSAESDRFILGVLGGPKSTGIFNAAKETASLPLTELVFPIGRALVPTLAKLSSDQNRQKLAISKSIPGTIIIAAPASFGLVLVSNEFVTLLFGDKWSEIIPIISILCLSGIPYALRETSAGAFILYGHIKTAAQLSWINAIMILFLFYPAYINYDVSGIAWLYVISQLITSLLCIAALRKFDIISTLPLIKDLWRPIFSAVIMFLSIKYIFDHSTLSTTLSLFIKILTGSIIYTTSLISLWFAAGKPESSEKVLITKIFHTNKTTK